MKCNVVIRFMAYLPGQWLLLPMLLLLFMAPVYGEALEEAPRQDRSYVFVGDHAFPPFMFLEAGRPTGLNVDVLQAVGRVMDLDVQIELLPGDDAQKAFEAGEADGLLGYPLQAGQLSSGHTSPISFEIYALFTRKNSTVAALDDMEQGVLIVPDEKPIHEFLDSREFKGTRIVLDAPGQILHQPRRWDRHGRRRCDDAVSRLVP